MIVACSVFETLTICSTSTHICVDVMKPLYLLTPNPQHHPVDGKKIGRAEGRVALNITAAAASRAVKASALR